MNTPAKTSHEHAARTTPRRRTPPPTPRPSSSLSILRVAPLLLFLATLVSLTRAASSRAAPTLNLPHVPATCDTLNLTWTGGTANYTLNVAYARTSIPLESWPALANTSVLWTVNVCGGTDLSLTLTDAGGYKSAVSFAVQYGTDGSCLSASQRASTSGCLIATAASTTRTSTATAKSSSNTNTGGSTAKGPKLATVVGVVVGVVVLLILWLSCMFTRRRQRRGVGVLGPGACLRPPHISLYSAQKEGTHLGSDASPAMDMDMARSPALRRTGSRPYFVQHERDRARRRDTLLEMPPPMYQDAAADASASANGEHPSNSSLSPPLSVADHHDQTRHLMRVHMPMPEPETVQMAQLPQGRVEPEQLPTPFVSPYEGSFAPASGEGRGHARGQTGAAHSGGATPEASSRGGAGEAVHDGGGGGGADEPPPPYTLTA